MSHARPLVAARALVLLGTLLSAAPPVLASDAVGGDLDAILERGVLRHLGIPYANFVTGAGDGFDVELVRGFAASLGVRYEFVETAWPAALPDLVGRGVSPVASDPATAPVRPVRGDLLATGLTVLPWRERAVAFSSPVFPTQVWVVARASSAVRPIEPTGSVPTDIERVKKLLARRELLAVAGTCLDPTLYALDRTGAVVMLKQIRLDEVAPALIHGEGELALLDVADAMIALAKWPGEVKVIGPISPQQEMAVAFRKDAPRLRQAFEEYLERIRRDGTYARLVKSYFPEAPIYFRSFFGAME